LSGNGRLDVSGSFPERSDHVVRLFERRPIAIPGSSDRHLAIVNVAGQTVRLERHAECDSAGDVTLAAAAALLG
jgi:hypothetical protein